MKFCRAIVRFVVVPAVLVGAGAVSGTADETTLGRPGYLILEAARDSTGGFTWAADDSRPGRTLSWATGRLALRDSTLVENFSRTDLGFPVGPTFAGRGSRGALQWHDGIFPVTEEVTLTDGSVTCVLWGGELEFNGPMIRYRAAVSAEPAAPWKAGMAFLAGMALLVWTLLRRSRRGWQDRGMSS